MLCWFGADKKPLIIGVAANDSSLAARIRSVMTLKREKEEKGRIQKQIQKQKIRKEEKII